MEFFDLVPDKFFSLLSGKNKNIYICALLTLNSLVNRNDVNIRKDEFVRFLKERASDDVESFSIEEEKDLSDFDGNIDSPSKANLIVSRLEETGWIEIELDPNTFEELIILPTYSIKMINTIFEIINESSETYTSLVHTTYSELKLEDEAKDEFMYATLIRVFENTKKLKVDLITLSHSIRIYQSRLNKLFSSNEVLHSYFDNYKELVSDRLYHPLKTFDSVDRFKRPIITILTSWINNAETRSYLIKEGIIFSKNTAEPKDIEKEIIEKVNYICDMYETINGLIDDIDARHRDYTKASANKILFFNNNDKSIKSMLENVLVGLAQNKTNNKVVRDVLSGMSGSINFYENGYLNPDSVTLPLNRKYISSDDPLPILDDTYYDELSMESFLQQVNGMFTDDKIYEFMREVFGNQKEIHSKDIPLLDDTAYILLILATCKNNDPTCFYIVDYESRKRIKSYNYIIPELTFRIKDETTKEEK